MTDTDIVAEFTEEEIHLSPQGAVLLALAAVGVATTGYFLGKGVGRVAFGAWEKIQARRNKPALHIVDVTEVKE